jgi:hypothetical protein
MLKNSWTLAVSVAINISMKLCFVSVNGPREPYLLDEPRISCLSLVSSSWKPCGFLYVRSFYIVLYSAWQFLWLLPIASLHFVSSCYTPSPSRLRSPIFMCDECLFDSDWVGRTRRIPSQFAWATSWSPVQCFMLPLLQLLCGPLSRSW